MSFTYPCKQRRSTARPVPARNTRRPKPRHPRPAPFLQVEPLEDRNLLSVFTYGAVGDSLTDEYFKGHGGADNWVEQVAPTPGIPNTRGLNFGRYLAPPNSWGGIRGTGYEYNWARGGASATLIPGRTDLASEVAGLAGQVQQGLVTLATVEIGVADMAVKYADIYSGALAGPALESYIQNVVGSIFQGVDTLRAAGNVHLVLANIADFGVTPYIRQNPAFSNPWGRFRVTLATAAADAEIQILANQRGIPVLNFFAYSEVLLASGQPILVGGVPINTAGYSSPVADPHDFFADSQHPGTIGSGLFANMFIAAIDQAYGASVAPLSDQELLVNAGITPPFPGPTYFDVSNLVIYPVPTLASLSPNTAVRGSAGFTLTLAGSNFLSTSTVRWDGTPLPTTFVSPMQLQALVPASDLDRPGTFEITVANPTPGGGSSNALDFTVTRRPAGRGQGDLTGVFALFATYLGENVTVQIASPKSPLGRRPGQRWALSQAGPGIARGLAVDSTAGPDSGSVSGETADQLFADRESGLMEDPLLGDFPFDGLPTRCCGRRITDS